MGHLFKLALAFGGGGILGVLLVLPLFTLLRLLFDYPIIGLLVLVLIVLGIVGKVCEAREKSRVT